MEGQGCFHLIREKEFTVNPHFIVTQSFSDNYSSATDSIVRLSGESAGPYVSVCLRSVFFPGLKLMEP